MSSCAIAYLPTCLPARLLAWYAQSYLMLGTAATKSCCLPFPALPTPRFHLHTAAANEHVPMKDQGYYLPFWHRLLICSAYVLLLLGTIVACMMVSCWGGRAGLRAAAAAAHVSCCTSPFPAPPPQGSCRPYACSPSSAPL